MSKVIYLMPQPKFPLGRIVITTAADEKLPPLDISRCLMRHSMGDWGDVRDEERETNDSALADDCRLFSIYRDLRGTTFWVITEADRSKTTVLLPDDY